MYGVHTGTTATPVGTRDALVVLLQRNVTAIDIFLPLDLQRVTRNRTTTHLFRFLQGRRIMSQQILGP